MVNVCVVTVCVVTVCVVGVVLSVLFVDVDDDVVVVDVVQATTWECKVVLLWVVVCKSITN